MALETNSYNRINSVFVKAVYLPENETVLIIEPDEHQMFILFSFKNHKFTVKDAIKNPYEEHDLIDFCVPRKIYNLLLLYYCNGNEFDKVYSSDEEEKTKDILKETEEKIIEYITYMHHYNNDYVTDLLEYGKSCLFISNHIKTAEKLYRAYVKNDNMQDSLLQRVAWYNLACINSLFANSSESIDALNNSIKHGFSDWIAMIIDPDLELIRYKKDFIELVRQLILNSSYDEFLMSWYENYSHMTKDIIEYMTDDDIRLDSVTHEFNKKLCDKLADRPHDDQQKILDAIKHARTKEEFKILKTVGLFDDENICAIYNITI
uniref:Uncharacterized protein n=1 Tax=viral metagenome TaxID=1070528 RepID=A0A6C0EBX0_9ZZZZ